MSLTNNVENVWMNGFKSILDIVFLSKYTNINYLCALLWKQSFCCCFIDFFFCGWHLSPIQNTHHQGNTQNNSLLYISEIVFYTPSAPHTLHTSNSSQTSTPSLLIWVQTLPSLLNFACPRVPLVAWSPSAASQHFPPILR